MNMELKSKDMNSFRTDGSRAIESLAKMAELMGYETQPKQMQLQNGCFVSSILHFFEDNPGAVEAIYDWVRETFATEIEENDAAEEEEDGQ